MVAICNVFYETSGLSLLLGKPAQREGARTGLEVLCEVLHPTLSLSYVSLMIILYKASFDWKVLYNYSVHDV